MLTTTPDPLDAVDVDVATQEILLAAAEHDIPTLRRLVRQHDRAGANAANVQDSETGYTPLHAAIAACEPGEREGKEGKEKPVSQETRERARAT
ncbi:Arginine N-methyltransferase 2, partial [Ascosphaera acerosa]